MRRLAFRSSLLACVAFTCLPAHAETADEASAVDAGDADAIVVTAARTELPASALPLTVDVIDSESLAQQVSIAGSVVDAVSNLSPSFSPTRQKLSGAGETLRGRSPLYAINGVPQSTPIRDGSRDGYTIDPFFIDRIELIYGSNALQGIGATGGVVNQVTVGPPTKDGFSGRALLQGSADNDFSSDGFGGKIAGLVSWRGGAFDATVGATYETRGAFYDADGRRIGVDGTQGEVQDSKSWSVFGRFGWQVSDSVRLDLIANHFELNGDGDYVVVAGNRATGLPTSSKRGTAPGTPPSNTANSVSLTLTDDDLAGGHLVAQLFYNKTNDVFGGPVPRPNDTFQDPTIAPNGTLFDQSANKSRKIGGKISYERTIIDGLTGTIGFDAMVDKTEQSLVQTGRAWVPPTEFVTLAPFGQLNLALLDDKVHLAGGVRWENDKLKVDDFHTLASTTLSRPAPNNVFGGVAVSGGSRSFQDALINGGVVIEPVEGVRAYASYAEGYTIADIGRILRGINQPNIDIDTYIDLEPVVSNNREIGVELKRGPLNASAAYFWSSSKKGSLLVLQNGVFNVQRQRIEIEGLELNVAVQMPIPGLDVSAGYAHLTGRTDSNQDEVVDIDLDGANISPDRFNLAANYRNGPFSARLQSQFYLSRRFDLFINPTAAQLLTEKENAFDGYTVVDASVRYATRFGGISLSVQNLLNEQYITYNSDTTRAGDNLLYFAGRGRTFTLGWDYRF